jgi:hypothetical protein
MKTFLKLNSPLIKFLLIVLSIFHFTSVHSQGDPIITQTIGHGFKLSEDNTEIGVQAFKWNRWEDYGGLLPFQAFKANNNYSLCG